MTRRDQPRHARQGTARDGTNTGAEDPRWAIGTPRRDTQAGGVREDAPDGASALAGGVGIQGRRLLDGGLHRPGGIAALRAAALARDKAACAR